MKPTLEVDAPDPDALPTVTVGVVGVLVLVIVIALVQGLYQSRSRAELRRKVVDQAPAELTSLRQAQNARLQATGWVDKKNGYVTIPIERAMKMLAADPNPAAAIILPEEPAASPSPAPSPAPKAAL